MKVIGRIGETVYLHSYGSSPMLEATLSDPSDLEYIDEYSSEYFIWLAAYGESPFEETEPITEHDRVLYNELIIRNT